MNRNFYPSALLAFFIAFSVNLKSAFAQNEEPRITSINIPGVDDVLCLSDQKPDYIEFETEGVFPEGVVFQAELHTDHGPGFLGEATGDERIIYVDEESWNIPGTQYLSLSVRALVSEDGITTPVASESISLDVVNPVVISSSFTTVQGDTIVEPGTSLHVGVEHHTEHWGNSYILVHEETGTSEQGWFTATDTPFNFTVEDPQPGTYRMYGRAVGANTGFVCQDSIPTDAHFTVYYPAQIVNLHVTGSENGVLCYDPEQEYYLEYDIEGNLSDDTELNVQLIGQTRYYEWIIGTTTAGEENRILLDFPPLSASGEYIIQILYNDDRSEPIEYFDIITPVNTDITINTTDNRISDGRLVVEPDEEVEFSIPVIDDNFLSRYKLVYEDGEESVTDWILMKGEPAEFTVDNLEEGNYRLYARGATPEGDYICHDSLATEAAFRVEYSEEQYGEIVNLRIPGVVNNVWCYNPEDENRLEFDIDGELPEDMEITAKLFSSTYGGPNITIGTATVGDGNIPLILQDNLPAISDDYYISIHYGEEISEQLIINIVLPIDDEVTLNPSGTIEIDRDEPLEGVIYHSGGYGGLFKLVHEESGESATDWLIHGDTPISFTLETHREGTYRLYARGAALNSEVICEDSVRTEAFFIIEYTGEEIEPEIYAKDAEGRRMQPDEDGVFRACEEERISVYTGNREGATYRWYVNGEYLRDINERANSIGADLGSGTYTVKVDLDDDDDDDYTLSAEIEFYEVPDDLEITAESDLLKAPDARSYQWYRDGSKLDGETERTLRPDRSGAYTVEITTERGCVAMSRDYAYTVTSVGGAYANNGVKAYPNPVVDRLSVETNLTGQAQVTVSGLEGNVVHSETVSDSGTLELELGNLNSGIYMVNIRNAGNSKTFKIIKQ